MTENQNATAKFYIQQILMEVRYDVPFGVRRITSGGGNTAGQYQNQIYDAGYSNPMPSTSTSGYY